VPAGALPREGLVRGSLVALAIAAVTGIVLLFWSPVLPGEHRIAKSSALNPASVLATRPAARAGSSAVPTPLPTVPGVATVTGVRSYTVVSGDTLSDIALNFGTSVAAIQSANPGIAANTLRPGQVLLVPPPGGLPTPAPSPTPALTTSPTPAPAQAATASPLPSPTPQPTPSPSPAPSPEPSVAPTPSPTPTG
jgi:LysM repeat protein